MSSAMLRRLAVIFLASVSLCGPLVAQVPGIINYQGRIVLNSTNYDGVGQFKFALVNGQGTSTLWSHDGTGPGGSEPRGSVSVPVTKGLYSVVLGQAPIMTISPTVFTNSDVRLRIWFNGGLGFQWLSPDQRIGAVGYAMVAADVADGAVGAAELASDSNSLAKVSGGLVSAGNGRIGIGTTNPVERLEVVGAVRLGGTSNASPQAGTIRWTGTDFEGFTGSRWVSLTSAPAPAGMVYVSGGTFTLGSQWVGGAAVPEHPVSLSSFYIGKYEVSYALWYNVRQWALANGYLFHNVGQEGNDGVPGAAPRGVNLIDTDRSGAPVTLINSRDAIVWCNARSEQEGLEPVYTYGGTPIRDARETNSYAVANYAVFNTNRNGYRLPTEAEWEYAARFVDGGWFTPGPWASGATGPTDVQVSYSPIYDPVAWYSVNSSNCTHSVGLKRANQLGLHDMSGNVHEWCWDWYDVFTANAVTNPVGPVGPNPLRAVRGGSWYHVGGALATSLRSFEVPSYYMNDLGFRCARTAH